MGNAPKITRGDVGPSVLAYGGYRPVEHREYHDGVIVQVEHFYGFDSQGRYMPQAEIAVAWDARQGYRRGAYARKVHSSAELGAVVKAFRAGKRTVVRYPYVTSERAVVTTVVTRL